MILRICRFRSCLRSSMSSTKFASSPGFGFLDHAPELKSLGIDCFLDRSAREVVRRSVIGTDRAGGGPGTMILRQLAAREVGRERPQILPRFRLENVNPHGLILSGVDDGRRMRHGASLEVGTHQIVRPFAAALINLGCRRADQVPMRIERAQQPRLVEAHVGLNALQRVLGDEECNFHRAVVSPKTHRAPRRIERAALVGKTQRHRRPFAAVHADVGSRHRPWPPAERGARSSYPLNPARYLLRARMMAVATKQVAAAKATLKRVIHMSRSLMIAGGSATGLSATSAWIVRVLWPMMVARLRLIRAIVQGTSTFIVDPIALLNPLREPRTVPDIRAWPCLSRRLVRLHPKAMLTSDGRSHDGRAAAIRFVQTRRPR